METEPAAPHGECPTLTVRIPLALAQAFAYGLRILYADDVAFVIRRAIAEYLELEDDDAERRWFGNAGAHFLEPPKESPAPHPGQPD